MPYGVTVDVKDIGGNELPAAGQTAVTVNDAALADISASASVSATVGVSTGLLTVATFTDANPGDHTTDFTATIDWGDNTGTSPGAVSYRGRTYSVGGTHTYSAQGSYPVTVNVTDVGGNQLNAGNTTVTVTGTGGPVVTTLVGPGQGLSSPADPAYYDGNLYVPNAGSNTISQVTLPSGQVSTYVDNNQGLNTPDGVTFDNSGNLYVANFHGNTISEVPQPNTVVLFANVNNPNGPVFDTNDNFNGNLYVCDKYDNMIMEVPSGGGAPSIFVKNTQGLSYPIALAFDSNDYFDGNLYVASQNNNTIYDVDSDGNATEFVSGGLISGPTSLVFGPDGNLYVYNSGTSEITRVTLTGSTVNVSNFVQLDPAAAGTYAGLVFDPAGNLYIANYGNSTISEIANAASVAGQAFTNQTVLHSSDADPNGPATQHKAVVTLGDGNSVTLPSTANGNGQIVANARGSFDVQPSYTYAEELNNVTQALVSYDGVGNTGGAGSLATRRIASFGKPRSFPARNGTPLSFSRFPVAWRSSHRFGVDRVSDPIPSESFSVRREHHQRFRIGDFHQSHGLIASSQDAVTRKANEAVTIIN
jgi:sugar lactone lactonase YvrE